MNDWQTVKRLGGGRIGGYAVLWGDAERRDLTGEFFTQRTQDLETLFQAMGRLPLLYQHAADGALKAAVVGPVDVLMRDEIGLWYEAQLSMAEQYRQAIDGLIEQGVLGTSSGTLPAARRVNRSTGEIERWAIAELSLTPTPAEPRMMERPVAEVAAAFKAVGLDLPDELDGLAAKAGRRLSARQLKRLAEAQETIADLVRWASYEEGADGEDGEDGSDEADDAKSMAPATGLDDMSEAGADAAQGPEDGQPGDDDQPMLKNVLIETERLALLKLAGG